ncbi:hypothetical protein [Lysinibacillus sphaericus]|uniref:hypothetical protein n=1 Tax=Lysinibacillus sphaericus TaxID=1421 RepID=UPI003D0641AE
MKQQEENKEEVKTLNGQKLTHSYMDGDTHVEVYGEFNVDLFAKQLHKLFTKKGINVYRDS